jgi:CRISPR/Cas system CSM-associated protein Csm2 small subunit
MTKSDKRNAIFNDGIKDIQSTIGRYNALSIFTEALRYLYSPAKDDLHQVSKQPWLILLMIQWTYLNPLAEYDLGRPAISHSSMLELLQKFLDLTDTGTMPDEFDDVRLFMRALAYQQFFHQTDNGLYDLARQRLIFANVPENHYFKTKFLNRTGVSVAHFLNLSFALYATVKRIGPTIEHSYLFDACPSIPPSMVDAFLRLISVNVKILHRELKALDVDGRGPDEYLRQTLFLRFPMVKLNSQYCCISPFVLARSLGYFIYDFLKRDDLENFNKPFGKSFESYVGECLSKSKLPTAKESELIQTLNGEGKVVDFLVVDGDANVLIDAKGVEMSQSGMTAIKRGTVRRATKTSLIKAFEQGHEVAARLPLLKTSHPVIKHRASTYLLAVTYKELYIGNGLTLAAMAGTSELEKIRAAHAEDTLIPFENIYFLSIGEFEELMHLVSEGEIGLVEALEKAKKADSNVSSQKFTFDLHINAWLREGKIDRPHPLKTVLKAMLEEVREIASPS